MSTDNNPSTTNSPRHVLLKLLEGLSNQDWDAVAKLYAEDVIIQWPLALPVPVNIRGRQTLQKTLKKGWKILELKASNIRIYETHDAEIVIAEYDYDGRVRANGKTFRAANMLILTVRNGFIISARGYHNHVIAAAALGNLEKIVPQFEINLKSDSEDK